jgi:hypothetical protein
MADLFMSARSIIIIVGGLRTASPGCVRAAAARCAAASLIPCSRATRKQSNPTIIMMSQTRTQEHRQYTRKISSIPTYYAQFMARLCLNIIIST